MAQLHMVSARLVEPGDTIVGDHTACVGDMSLTVYARLETFTDGFMDTVVHGWNECGQWVKRTYRAVDVVAVRYG